MVCTPTVDSSCPSCGKATRLYGELLGNEAGAGVRIEVVVQPICCSTPQYVAAEFMFKVATKANGEECYLTLSEQ